MRHYSMGGCAMKLSNMCHFVSDKVKVSELNRSTYISTENMYPNRGGITLATSLPTTQKTNAFAKFDILVSNIRPYFKKIWKATNAGGCSNDILVFRAATGTNPAFLYYVLADDRFFDYATSTSKGTKMPRGDKVAIMEYEVPNCTPEHQRKIAAVLSALDDKIELNNKINKNLEEQAQALFKSWFINFEPFGGIMPKDWKVGIADDIITLFDSQRIPLSSNQRENMEKIYPYYGATSLMDYVDKYIFNGKYLLLGEDGTVVDDYGFPILQYVWGKFWVNNHAHILQGRNGFTVESLYLFFKCTNVKSIVTGAVQPKINQANLKSIPAIIPTINVMSNFNNVINPLFSLFRKNVEENSRLATLRDALLPKLMSGEIDVSKVDISDPGCLDKLSFSDEGADGDK